MKIVHAILIACSITSLHAADNNPVKSYHATIAELAKFLVEKHPTTITPKLQRSSKKPTNYTAIAFTLKRKDGLKIDTDLQALHAFDWEKENYRDAIKGSQLAARHAQFLALANAAVTVENEEKDDDGNLMITLKKAMCVDLLKEIFEQVPGTQGLVAFLPHGRAIMKTWIPQEERETDAN